MSNFFRTVFALMIVGFVAASFSANAQEEEVDLGVEFTLDNASQYIWRGIVVNDEQVLQPSATVAVGGLSLNVWANYDMTENGLRGDDNISEVDYTLAYEGQVEQFVYGLGVIYYDYPGTDIEETAEVFGSLGLDVMLNPTLTVFYDFDEADGFYGTLAIGHSIPLNDEETFSLDLGASIGYADSDYNEYYFPGTPGPLGAAPANDDGFVDAVASVGLAYAITENIGVGVSVSYSELVDSDVEDAADAAYGDSDAFWTTFSVTVGF